jgi:hypothetical protein
VSKEEEERSRQIAKAAVKELMDQVYRGVGRGLIERVLAAPLLVLDPNPRLHHADAREN